MKPLLNRNQLRCSGLTVHDTPTMFDPASTHLIYDPASGIRIPLDLNGVISYFPTYAPTLEEANLMKSIALTSTANWTAVSAAFPDQQSISNFEAAVPYHPSQHMFMIEHDYTLLETSNDCDLHARLVAAVNVHPHQHSDLALEVDKMVYPNVDGCIAISALSTEERCSVLSPEVLAKRWGIGLNSAKAKLLNTTQDGVRNVYLPSERKTRKKTPWMHFPSFKGDYFTDQMFSKIPLAHNDTGGSLFTNGLGYDRFYPWKGKGEHPQALMEFIHDSGVPQTLVSDNALEETHGATCDICRKHHIKQRVTVPHSPWQNLVEASNPELKKSCRRMMRQTGTPTRLWTYCMTWCAAIRRLTYNSIP
jgi:hypothetical protein